MAGFEINRDAAKKLQKDIPKKIDKQLGTTHSTTEIKKKAKELHKEQGL